MITVREFAKEAKDIMLQSAPLPEKQAAVADILSELSRRDDLLSLAVPVGHSDATTSTFMLLRNGTMGVMIAGFAPHYQSPVHEHGNFWVIACGYRGVDRWKMYERLDGGTKPGYSEVRFVEERVVAPHTTSIMPPPPRAIHQHNNITAGETLELLFSYNEPLGPDDRLIYDVEGNACWPSGFKLAGIYGQQNYPSTWRSRLSEATSSYAHSIKAGIKAVRRPVWNCAICMAMGSIGRPTTKAPVWECSAA
ncbi:MAG: hypothetical protein M9924_20120 [Rhizobiaceae bacterium]|nr:hypothetical protein [Rhizobiaceae bacterium]